MNFFLYFSGPDNTYTCCGTDQLLTIVDQFSLAGKLIQRCPACYYNFRSLFCAMTCSPTHSNFISIETTEPSSLDANKTSVLSIHYNVATDFVQRIISSCR